MSSMTASSPQILFLNLLLPLPKPTSLSFLSLRIRAQDHPTLRRLPYISPRCRQRRDGRRRRGIPKRDDGFDIWDSCEDLEAEVYDFMLRSDNPSGFPTRKQLMDAGRADLAKAITAQGGWLAFGWCLEDVEASEFEKESVPEGEERSSSESACLEACSSSPPIRSLEIKSREIDGIEGILGRLQEERNQSFGLSLEFGGGNGGIMSRNNQSELEVTVVGCDNGRNISTGDGNILNEGSLVNYDKSHCSPDKWRIWRLKRAGLAFSEFEAADIVPGDGMPSLQDPGGAVVRHGEKHEPDNPSNVADPKGRQNQMHFPLCQLESDLQSQLHSFKSPSNSIVSLGENKLGELRRLSDAWEFQETEMMNARDKLRSLRAKLSVLEGKTALELIDAQKRMEEKQRRINGAKNALKLLRTVYLVWSNTASEVLLAGSFDGWTGRKKMEKSAAGFFSLYLKLYPGRYEIKFIVDGVWKVDPLRELVFNNGNENNLLVIS